MGFVKSNSRAVDCNRKSLKRMNCIWSVGVSDDSAFRLMRRHGAIIKNTNAQH